MGIFYDERQRVFHLNTPSSTYLIGLIDDKGLVGHLYYGKRIDDLDVESLIKSNDVIRFPSECNGECLRFLDGFQAEYATAGIGDYRESCLEVRTQSGHNACMLTYVVHKIYPGKPSLDGLPSTFGTKEECSTLEIICEDPLLHLQVELIYTVFEKIDAITRSVRVTNKSEKPIYLTRVLSACLDMDNENYDIITLDGVWAKERMITRRQIVSGKQRVSSNRGVSSHQANPFIAVVDRNASQDFGKVYGMNFVYSGNFMAQAELTQFDMLRVTMGILPENFSWKLLEGEHFTAPEVVMVFSEKGIGGMTRSYHDLYRNNLIRGKYCHIQRPVLINNWEATYFQFDTEKIISIAKMAASLGIEMLVLDDGWFGRRNSDTCALGDWYVNEEKLKGGLPYLVSEIHKLGMKFGLWFEPEMISPDSDLYRKHPDWAIQIPGREPTQCRNQLVLDLTRKDVRDALYEQIKTVLCSASIEYVKWDMNRSLSDLGSYNLEADRQGELSHRYMLAVYELQERLITEFPDILLENCSSGGGRYDPGMLYYSPQIWCSDNTDAIERLRIQEGTAMVYPLGTMGAHVSDCPCHSNGRVTPFDTRGYIALTGTFGYELDVTRITEEERNQIPEQISMYHKYNDLIREGDYYRITSYQENHENDSFIVVSKDKQEAVAVYIQVEARPKLRSIRIRLKGLEEDYQYTINDGEKIFSGAMLMNAGITMDELWGDYQGKLLYFKKA